MFQDFFNKRRQHLLFNCPHDPQMNLRHACEMWCHIVATVGLLDCMYQINIFKMTDKFLIIFLFNKFTFSNHCNMIDIKISNLQNDYELTLSCQKQLKFSFAKKRHLKVINKHSILMGERYRRYCIEGLQLLIKTIFN